MPKVKKPAPKKGGEKKAAPKKKARKSVTNLTERQADQLAADRMRDESYVAANKPQALNDSTATKPLHPTVEEQWSDYEGISARLAERTAMLTASVMSGVNLAPLAYDPPAPKPSLLRRALNRVKRAFRFRSAKTGEFVSQAEAEASPDTTVLERVK